MTDFQKLYDFGNLYRAYRKARQLKRSKYSVMKFEANLLEQINQISEELKSGRYIFSPYHTFKVFEPKERDVMANSFRDKVVQHSLCDNIIEARFTPHFILDNYAGQQTKGTDFGLQRLEEFMRSYFFSRKAKADAERKAAGLPPLPTEQGNYADGWVLKCDIRKYFYSIPHEPLKATVRKYLDDPDILRIVDTIIDSTPSPGIPIGNQTSQWFAVAFLNGLDHFIKEKLRIRFYGRYMDDFFLICEDKQYLQYCRAEIERFVGELGLELNEKTSIFPLRNGIDFLGFHTYLTDTGRVIRKVRKNSKEKAKRKMRGQRKRLDRGEITLKQPEDSYQAWRSHAMRGNCYNLTQKTDELFNRIFKESVKWRKKSAPLQTAVSSKTPRPPTTASQSYGKLPTKTTAATPRTASRSSPKKSSKSRDLTAKKQATLTATVNHTETTATAHRICANGSTAAVRQARGGRRRT